MTLLHSLRQSSVPNVCISLCVGTKSHKISLLLRQKVSFMTLDLDSIFFPSLKMLKFSPDSSPQIQAKLSLSHLPFLPPAPIQRKPRLSPFHASYQQLWVFWLNPSTAINKVAGVKYSKPGIPELYHFLTEFSVPFIKRKIIHIKIFFTLFFPKDMLPMMYNASFSESTVSRHLDKGMILCRHLHNLRHRISSTLLPP